MVCFCNDGVWFVIWIKIQLFKFKFLGRLILNRGWIFLKFPFLEAEVRKSEDFVFYFGIEDNFIEILSLVNNLRYFLATIFTDNVDGIEANFGISLMIDILELSDGVCSGIFFFMLFDRVKFDHLIGPFPENVDSWIKINGHYHPNLNILWGAFFIGWKLKFRNFEGFSDFSLLVYLPTVKQFDFLLLQIRSDDSNVVLMGLYIFNDWL